MNGSFGDGRTRLRAFNGLYPDPRNGSGRDGTPLTARTKNGAGTQRWDTGYAEFGDNLVRLRALGGGKRCVDLANADRPRPGDRTVLGDCSDHRAEKDGTGHRRQAEMYGDGTLRFRNESAHPCLAAPLRGTGYVTIESCGDSPRQRWTIVP